MTNTPELSRRGFLGAGLALIAAPAVVRAESLMRVVAPPDWRGFVRELRQYDPVNDEWALRWDVRFRGQQFHATARAYSDTLADDVIPMLREPALECLRNELKSRNVSAFELERLPLPTSLALGRNGVR